MPPYEGLMDHYQTAFEIKREAIIFLWPIYGRLGEGRTRARWQKKLWINWLQQSTRSFRGKGIVIYFWTKNIKFLWCCRSCFSPSTVGEACALWSSMNPNIRICGTCCLPWYSLSSQWLLFMSIEACKLLNSAPVFCALPSLVLFGAEYNYCSSWVM